jgi:hypothetical protein
MIGVKLAIASVSSDSVVLISYPTGIEGILARAGNEITHKSGGKRQVPRLFRGWV